MTADGSKLEGFLVEDDFCLDSKYDICVEKFSFLSQRRSTDALKDKRKITLDGVIPFNKFNVEKFPNQQLPNMLDAEDIFFNSTIHFDL